jgi:hypothetical protein
MQAQLKTWKAYGILRSIRFLPTTRRAWTNGNEVYFDPSQETWNGRNRTPEVSWSRFANDDETKTPPPQENGFFLPREPFDRSDMIYYAADIHKDGDTKKSVTVYVRTLRGQAEVVGVERSW